LGAPAMRCASIDTLFNLEQPKNFMAYSKLDETIEKLMDY
jgi:hypothetical protein